MVRAGQVCVNWVAKCIESMKANQVDKVRFEIWQKVSHMLEK